mmetsp:Transcript_2119/g.6114  ORF Transcript_2119/g.6114 Transcript_2119/m.6114 type:complete len:263 (-) Transcript_2119:240-1028(-)
MASRYSDRFRSNVCFLRAELAGRYPSRIFHACGRCFGGMPFHDSRRRSPTITTGALMVFSNVASLYDCFFSGSGLGGLRSCSPATAAAYASSSGDTPPPSAETIPLPFSAGSPAPIDPIAPSFDASLAPLSPSSPLPRSPPKASPKRNLRFTRLEADATASSSRLRSASSSTTGPPPVDPSDSDASDAGSVSRVTASAVAVPAAAAADEDDGPYRSPTPSPEADPMPPIDGSSYGLRKLRRRNPGRPLGGGEGAILFSELYQ